VNFFFFYFNLFETFQFQGFAAPGYKCKGVDADREFQQTKITHFFI
jgi:hypothetical protein